MARTKREVSESGIYRINLRGNDGVIFKSEEDYAEFTALLEKYFKGGVIAYSLNEGSADLVVRTEKEGIGIAMKPFLTSYARYFNRVYNRTGKVFYDRYKSSPVDYREVLAVADALPDGVKYIRYDVEGLPDKLLPDEEVVKKLVEKMIDMVDEAEEKKVEEESKTEEKQEEKREQKKMDFWLL